MTITVSQKIEKEVKNLSNRLGLSREDFITNAVLYYTSNLSKELNLKDELTAWDRASNLDLIKFEKMI